MNTSAERDRQLIERLQCGRTEAFDELLAPYMRKLSALVSHVVNNPYDADDAMQDALLRMYRGLKNFRGDADFYTWSYRVALNSALDLLSRRRRLSVEECGAGNGYCNVAVSVSSSDDPEHALAVKQMAMIVCAALESMRVEYKTAIILRELEGLSYHEIAETMLCPVGTVKSRISSARIAIAQSLRRRGALSGAQNAR